MKSAAALTEAIIRLLYNEKPDVLMSKVYGRERKEKDPYFEDKVKIAYGEVGGWVRWLGSLDDESTERLARHAVERELEKLKFYDGSGYDDAFMAEHVTPKREALRSFL